MHQHIVLIIDDDDDTREALAALLASEGLVIRTAVGRGDALRAVAVDPAPCVILLDYRIPGVDSAALLEELRTRTAGATAVLLLTGDMEAAAKLEGTVGHVLLKPIEPRTLRATVEQHCAHATSPAH